VVGNGERLSADYYWGNLIKRLDEEGACVGAPFGRRSSGNGDMMDEVDDDGVEEQRRVRVSAYEEASILSQTRDFSWRRND
jgi:hypothetical protein